MKNILLVCNAGMSTSLLVKKMQEAAANESEEYNISAVGLSAVDSELKSKKIDVLLIGPQVRFKEKELKEKYEPDVKVSTIEPMDYGMVNGQKVFDYAKSLI